MATAWLLCGLPGAGKTTRARTIAREHGAIVFSEDPWVTALYGHVASHDNTLRDRVKAVQWNLGAEILAADVDVVFDWGVWSRSERDFYRAQFDVPGSRLTLIYLNVPLAQLHDRIAIRNAALPPDTFHITPAELDEWWAIFEPPDPDEQAIA